MLDKLHMNGNMRKEDMQLEHLHFKDTVSIN